MAEAIDEDALTRINGLVARHMYVKKNGGNADALMGIELELLRYGVRLRSGIGPGDPRAPQGGSHAAIRAAA